MRFKEYLATRQVSDSPQGDFTTDARSDRHLPDCATWPELKRYLMGGGHCHAIEAAQAVWQGYQSKLKRDRKL